jgi:hypothetical protein
MEKRDLVDWGGNERKYDKDQEKIDTEKNGRTQKK